MIPDYPLGKMVIRQINESRLDINPKLGQAIASYNYKRNLDNEMREHYDVMRTYYEMFPEPDEPPTVEKVERVLKECGVI